MGFCALAFVSLTDCQAHILHEFESLQGSSVAVGDAFGANVAISDGTVIAGAQLDDTSGSNKGAAYLLSGRGTQSWSQVKKITASISGDTDGGLGNSVAIAGSTVMIGALFEDDKGINSGAVHILERDAQGNWSETNKLLASDGQFGDWFGSGLAATNSTLVVAAVSEGLRGAAYVFERNGSNSWIEVQKLTIATGDAFGFSNAVDGNTILISDVIDSTSGDFAGAIYFYQRNINGEWISGGKIRAADTADQDEFGYSVGISENTAIVGAPFDDDGGNSMVRPTFFSETA